MTFCTGPTQGIFYVNGACPAGTRELPSGVPVAPGTPNSQIPSQSPPSIGSAIAGSIVPDWFKGAAGQQNLKHLGLIIGGGVLLIVGLVAFMVEGAAGKAPSTTTGT